jgi:hypothetical protein
MAAPGGAPRFLYLATADARGHLMRAQLLCHALRQRGAEVEVLTTSDAGAEFLAEFGIRAPVLSRHYAVVFDEWQNMLRGATDRNIAAYTLLPQHMLRDIFRLRRLCRNADLVINDSFHPALLVMGLLPPWRGKIVHVFGGSLRRALEQNFAGRTVGLFARTFAFAIARMIESARAWIEHDFATPEAQRSGRNGYQLATPVAVPQLLAGGVPAQLAVYLNPHFRDVALAEALEQALFASGRSSHRVGEGYASRAGWLARDPAWVSVAANARVIVTAPGMAGLAAALLFEKPVVLVLTDQPEQHSNAMRAVSLGLPHRIVRWQHDAADFSRQMQAAIEALCALPATGDFASARLRAEQRLAAWVGQLWHLAAPPVADVSG